MHAVGLHLHPAGWVSGVSLCRREWRAACELETGAVAQLLWPSVTMSSIGPLKVAGAAARPVCCS